MNNFLISLIVAVLTTFFVVITETKKENRQSVGLRTFIAAFFVTFVALTYLLDSTCLQDIETGDGGF